MGLKIRHLLFAAAAFALLALPVHAQQKYDSRIAAAAARIVAQKIGDIRGGFSWQVRLVEIIEPPIVPSVPPVPDFTVTGSIITLN